MNCQIPYTAVIPGDSNYSFAGMANAAYFQRAIVSLGGQQSAVCNGQGEGMPMTTAGGWKSYGGAMRGLAQVSVLSQYSTDGVN